MTQDDYITIQLIGKATWPITVWRLIIPQYKTLTPGLHEKTGGGLVERLNGYYTWVNKPKAGKVQQVTVPVGTKFVYYPNTGVLISEKLFVPLQTTQH